MTNEEKLQMISDILQSYMNKHHLNQAQLSDRMGLEKSYTNKIISCKAKLTLTTISEIEERLNITLIGEPSWRATQ